MTKELTEEEVFANDIDPLDGLRQLRQEEGDKDAADAIGEHTGTNAEDVIDDKDKDDDLSEFDDDKDDDKKEDDDNSNSEEGSTTDDGEDDNSESDNNAGSEEKGENSQEEKSEKTDTDSEDDSDEGFDLAKVRTFKAGGKEFEFTAQEMLDQFETIFGQAMDYTQKTQAIAPYRKMISALESEGISHDDLNLAIDALKGEKGAIQALMKAGKIEAFDLTNEEGKEAESNYTPKQYGKNDYQLELEEVTDAISGDEEYAITVDVIGKQWDQKSRQAFADNPSMIQGLHNDIKSGLYDKVAPVAMKMKVLDGNSKSDIEYYMLAGEQLQQSKSAADGKKSVDELNKKTQDAEDKFDQASSEAKKKRAASSTGARADRKGVVDYLDDDDEAFDEWYKNLQASN